MVQPVNTTVTEDTSARGCPPVSASSTAAGAGVLLSAPVSTEEWVSWFPKTHEESWCEEKKSYAILLGKRRNI